MREILLTKGYVTLVDDETYEFLNGYAWSAKENGKNVYAVSYINGKSIKMHNLLLFCKLVDHKDRNSLNNQKYNLRPCTTSQNAVNGTRAPSASTGYRYIYKMANGRYRVKGFKNRKSFHFGYFKTIEDALKERNIRLSDLHGEFVVLNDIANAP